MFQAGITLILTFIAVFSISFFSLRWFILHIIKSQKINLKHIFVTWLITYIINIIAGFISYFILYIITVQITITFAILFLLFYILLLILFIAIVLKFRYVINTFKAIYISFCYIIIILIVYFSVRWFVVETYKVPTQSSYPTIIQDDDIIVTKYNFGLRTPFSSTLINWIWANHGDMVIFKHPHYLSPGISVELINALTIGIFKLDNTSDNPKYFLKRIIGMPGDSIAYYNKKFTINNKELQYSPVNDINLKKENIISNQIILKEYFSNENFHLISLDVQQLEVNKNENNESLIERLYVPQKGKEITFNQFKNQQENKFIDPEDNLYIFKDINEMIEIYYENNKIAKKYIDFYKLVFYYENKEMIMKKLNKSEEYLFVLMSDLIIFVNNYLKDYLTKNKQLTFQIKNNYYYLAGDNRDNSIDSRYFGFVSEKLIYGKARYIILPFDRIGEIK